MKMDLLRHHYYNTTCKRLRLFAFFSLAFIQLCAAQNTDIVALENSNPFVRYNLEDGLSQNSVSAMVVDRQGYIWIGTQDGLNRFDGYGFEVFRNISDDGSSIRSDYITDLLLDEKDNLWIGTLDGELNYLDKKSGTFTAFEYDLQPKKGVGSNSISELELDAIGNLWVGTLNGLQKFSTVTKEFLPIKNEVPTDLKSNKIIGLLVDSDNRLWVSTKSALYVYKIKGKGLEEIEDIDVKSYENIGRKYDSPNDPVSIEAPGFIAEDHESNIFLLNAQDLIKYSRSTAEFTLVKVEKEEDNRFTSLYFDRQGGYWISSLKKLFHLQPGKSGYKKSLSYEIEGDATSLSAGSNITSVTQDNSGSIWVGSWAGGLNRLNLSPAKFKDIRAHPFIGNSSIDISVTALHVDQKQNIWMGTWGDGLYKLNFDSKINEAFHWSPSEGNSIRSSMVAHINEVPHSTLWISTHDGGLNRLDLKTGKFLPSWTSGNARIGDVSNSLSFSFNEGNKSIWLSTFQSGLIRANLETNTFKIFSTDEDNHSSISDNRPRTIFEDSEKRLWISTDGGGLNLFDRQKNTFRHFFHAPGNLHSIPNNIVNTIIESRNGDIWIGTYSGLAKLVDLENGIFRRYLPEDGSVNTVICAIEEDEQWRLWMSTFNGIQCFDMHEERFVNYGVSDGIINQEFNNRASAKDPNTGEIYFGGQNTCTYFQPDDFSLDTSNAKIAITSMVVHNSDLRGDGKTKHLFVNPQEDYSFSYQDKILSFKIAGLSFQKTKQQRYQYQLLGFSDQWYALEEGREIVFTNLDPGSYTLFAKVSNADGYWSGQQKLLAFSVSSPWHQTIWAYMLFLSLVLLGTYFLYHFQLSRRMATQERDRLKELDKFKSRFYSNITHEFRTPLTVISGMADELENNIEKEPQKRIDLIRKNSRNLLTLVNQMLDLSKLQAGKMASSNKQTDIISFLKYLTEGHHSFSKLRNIGLQFYSEEKELVLDFDADQMKQVMNNLISNSIKFTNEYGEILVVVKKGLFRGQAILEIRVKDNGIGISEEELPHIFDRFHQANPIHGNQGSGIGLALVKELMTSMKGVIIAESELDVGTTFILRFPITNKAPLSKGKLKTEVRLASPLVDTFDLKSPAIDSNLPLLLIIEDNLDVTYYLKTSLEDHYQILSAKDGKEGIDKAMEVLPDIVITDVMMPIMDGLEVCEKLKGDERSNHIPIILLTAKATSEDKISGLTHGADVYLTKPFEKEELLIQLNNLLEVRKTLQEKYSSTLLSSQDIDIKPLTKEEIFVKKIEGVILTNLDNEDFSVHELARGLLLSRSQVHRKIKALTGMSSANYIRHVRLHRAKELLTDTDLTVSEIAYQVGFKTLSYFSQAFKDTFGISPSAMRR